MGSRAFLGSMWLRAFDTLDRAERLRSQYFSIGRIGQAHAWHPPVDLFESGSRLLIRAAIPDASSSDVQVSLEEACLRLSGQIAFPAAASGNVIHRLEIPYGRIERVITLPSGRFELESIDYRSGCLEIRLLRHPAPVGEHRNDD